MAKDSDLPTIFHPKRVRAPSVIITSEEPGDGEAPAVVDNERDRPNGPPTPLSPKVPLTPQTSVSSAPPLTTQPSLQQAYSESATSSQDEERQLRDKKCPRSCCSRFAKKVISYLISRTSLRPKTCILSIPDVLWCLCNNISYIIMGCWDTQYKTSLYGGI